MLSFDDACIRFTAACVVASQWKHNYPGAAYSTRLYQAIGDLKAEIVLMEAVLEKDAAEGAAAIHKLMTERTP